MFYKINLHLCTSVNSFIGTKNWKDFFILTIRFPWGYVFSSQLHYFEYKNLLKFHISYMFMKFWKNGNNSIKLFFCSTPQENVSVKTSIAAVRTISFWQIRRYCTPISLSGLWFNFRQYKLHSTFIQKNGWLHPC